MLDLVENKLIPIVPFVMTIFLPTWIFVRYFWEASLSMCAGFSVSKVCTAPYGAHKQKVHCATINHCY